MLAFGSKLTYHKRNSFIRLSYCFHRVARPRRRRRGGRARRPACRAAAPAAPLPSGRPERRAEPSLCMLQVDRCTARQSPLICEAGPSCGAGADDD